MEKTSNLHSIVAQRILELLKEESVLQMLQSYPNILEFYGRYFDKMKDYSKSKNDYMILSTILVVVKLKEIDSENLAVTLCAYLFIAQAIMPEFEKKAIEFACRRDADALKKLKVSGKELKRKRRIASLDVQNIRKQLQDEATRDTEMLVHANATILQHLNATGLKSDITTMLDLIHSTITSLGNANVQ